MACKTLVPQPSIEPILLALGAWSLNHWTAREVLKWSLKCQAELFAFLDPPKGNLTSVCFNLICDNAQANEHAMEKRTSSAGRGGVSFLIWSCNSLRETVSISTSNDYIWVTELFPKVKKGTYWRQTPRHTPALTPWWRGKHCKRRMYRNGGASHVLPHQFNVESALTEHLTNDIPSMYPQYLLTAPTPWRNCMGQITAAWFHMLAPSPTSITKE